MIHGGFERRPAFSSTSLLHHYHYHYYYHTGFMMNSEVWVCHPGGPEQNLAFVLVEAGYAIGGEVKGAS